MVLQQPVIKGGMRRKWMICFQCLKFHVDYGGCKYSLISQGRRDDEMDLWICHANAEFMVGFICHSNKLTNMMSQLEASQI